MAFLWLWLSFGFMCLVLTSLLMDGAHRLLKNKKRPSFIKKYGFFWFTGGIFIVTFSAQLYFGYVSYEDSVSPKAGFWDDFWAGVFENWQSEFLSVLWQVACLRVLWFVGSPQSKEQEERTDLMLEYLIEHHTDEAGKKFLADLERIYPKK